jgi:hypothetical protein
LLWRHVLLLRADKTPNFVALQTAHTQAAHGAVMEVSAGAANLA